MLLLRHGLHARSVSNEAGSGLGFDGDEAAFQVHAYWEGVDNAHVEDLGGHSRGGEHCGGRVRLVASGEKLRPWAAVR